MDKIKRWLIIKKAIKQVLEHHKNSQPQIVDTLFYGAYGLNPQHLVIWYLFNTIAEEERARTLGLEERIVEETTQSLIDFGYPSDAFNLTLIGWVTYIRQSKEPDDKMIEERVPDYAKVLISFTSLEDIELKANGDWRMYFQ